MADIAGTLQDPTSLLLTTTSVTDVLSLVAGSNGIATAYGLIVVNRDSTPRLVTFWWTSGVTDYALYEGTIGANESTYIKLDPPIRLFAKSTARKIRAQAAASNVVTVSVIHSLSNQQAQSAG